MLGSERMTHLHISAYLFGGIGFREVDTTTHLGLMMKVVIRRCRVFSGIVVRETDTTIQLGLPAVGYSGRRN